MRQTIWLTLLVVVGTAAFAAWIGFGGRAECEPNKIGGVINIGGCR